MEGSLASLLFAGGREGALQRSHERTNLSHGIVSGFRIVSLFLSHATRSPRRRRQRDWLAVQERLTAWMDCLSPTVRRSVDFKINDLYLSTRREKGRKEGRKEGKVADFSHKYSIRLWHLEELGAFSRMNPSDGCMHAVAPIKILAHPHKDVFLRTSTDCQTAK